MRFCRGNLDSEMSEASRQFSDRHEDEAWAVREWGPVHKETLVLVSCSLSLRHNSVPSGQISLLKSRTWLRAPTENVRKTLGTFASATHAPASLVRQAAAQKLNVNASPHESRGGCRLGDRGRQSSETRRVWTPERVQAPGGKCICRAIGGAGNRRTGRAAA